jgi:site-specific DNA-methyltransferase (cytosine-N4-specific)
MKGRTMLGENYYSTKNVSKIVGVHRDTLLRWLREGKISEPQRDRNNWRIFSKKEVDSIIRYANAVNESLLSEKKGLISYSDHINKLKELNWDFENAKTEFLNHSIHPYPCKFIPQIPNSLIQELSSIGDTVMDPFSGSGTTLVEALRLGRNAIGIDANPLSTLICRVKTTRLESEDANILSEFAKEIINIGQNVASKQLNLFEFSKRNDVTKSITNVNPWIADWFDKHVINELTSIKQKCLEIKPDHLRDLALLAFSSIIVNVSRQDSDTRYVRRTKKIGEGDTFRKFGVALQQAVSKQLEFSSEVAQNVSATVKSANILSQPDISQYDLLVCSPPYPNAYSYHLYHRSRMLWLEMDPEMFKREEIGSHRKYSSKGKNAANKETFKEELKIILSWIGRYLRSGRHACFVIGDSTIRGEKVTNDELLIDVAGQVGFEYEANISRSLQAGKKSFNPSIGKIKDEHIVILKNISR